MVTAILEEEGGADVGRVLRSVQDTPRLLLRVARRLLEGERHLAVHVARVGVSNLPDGARLDEEDLRECEHALYKEDGRRGWQARVSGRMVERRLRGLLACPPRQQARRR